MVKEKLVQIRTKHSFSQQFMADKMCIDVSTYNRKEKGSVKIREDEWQKLAVILGVPIEDIYEPEEVHHFVFKDNAVGNYLGTNHIYSIPEHILESQRKYIEILEQEIFDLKSQLNK